MNMATRSFIENVYVSEEAFRKFEENLDPNFRPMQVDVSHVGELKTVEEIRAAFEGRM